MSQNTVLISGGSSDIGRAVIARIRNEVKCRLIITKSKSRTEQENYANKVIEADLSKRDGISALCLELSRENVTHYIQLQGFSTLSDTIENQNFDSLDCNLNVNLLSTVFILKTILPKMKEGGLGRIVLMSTASAEHGGGAESFGYGMAKHGVAYLVRHIAKLYSGNNILANCVSPGFISTKLHEKTFRRSKEELENRKKFVRVGHAGTAEDVANAIFGLTFNNNFITGENIKIDGGDFI
jgi:3-oxoacyl-[acyl-carrier protein] reductase